MYHDFSIQLFSNSMCIYVLAVNATSIAEVSGTQRAIATPLWSVQFTSFNLTAVCVHGRVSIDPIHSSRHRICSGSAMIIIALLLHCEGIPLHLQVACRPLLRNLPICKGIQFADSVC